MLKLNFIILNEMLYCPAALPRGSSFTKEAILNVTSGTGKGDVQETLPLPLWSGTIETRKEWNVNERIMVLVLYTIFFKRI